MGFLGFSSSLFNFPLSLSFLQSEARRCTRWRFPDRRSSRTRGSDSAWDTNSVWHHAAGLWVSGPEQGWRAVSGQQEVCVGACLWGTSGDKVLAGGDTSSLNDGLFVIKWFPGTEIAHCRASVVFLLMCVCSLPDRRTNPFGETDDDCSTESDGNHFPLLNAT